MAEARRWSAESTLGDTSLAKQAGQVVQMSDLDNIPTQLKSTRPSTSRASRLCPLSRAIRNLRRRQANLLHIVLISEDKLGRGTSRAMP